MKEQSQIEEMRAAVRGDIERAERRRRNGAAPPASVLEPPPVAEVAEESPKVARRRFTALFRGG